MPDKENSTFFEVPPEIKSFAPPPAAKYEAMVDGTLQMFPMAGVVGTLGQRFEFFEPGGTSHLKPGRPLSRTVSINIPPNVGFFVMLNGFIHAYVHGDNPNLLRERPLGQMSAHAGVNFAARTLTCSVRLTDSNSDDPVRIIVDVVVVFFN